MLNFKVLLESLIKIVYNKFSEFKKKSIKGLQYITKKKLSDTFFEFNQFFYSNLFFQTIFTAYKSLL